jgi:hypothetical protein
MGLDYDDHDMIDNNLVAINKNLERIAKALESLVASTSSTKQ